MKRNGGLFGALALYIMLALALLMVTLFGAKLYQNVTAAEQANARRRATLAYVQSRVAAADSSGGVSVRSAPEGNALVLKEADATYEVYIYLYAGTLFEQTGPAGTPYAPETAQKIAECGTFEVQMEDGMLTLSADGCTALAALRSEEDRG